MFKIIKGSANFICGINKISDIDKFVITSPEPMIGLCMVGRSNVGKSSLINTIFGNKTARTSNTPGRTREINMFRFSVIEDETKQNYNFYLFDLPGYGYAEVSKQIKANWKRLMTYFFDNLLCDIILVNIQDARNPNQNSDSNFQNFIRGYSLKTLLVFNKIDKLKKQKDRFDLEKLKPKIFEKNKWVEAIFYVSAEKRIGIDQLEECILSYLIQFHEKP